MYPIEIDKIEYLDRILMISDLIMLKYNNIWNYNLPYKILIETDTYGNNFQFDENSYIDANQKIFFDNINYSFNEIFTNEEFETETTQSYESGIKEIEVKDNQFNINDVIKIKDNLYKIIGINENIIILDTPLISDVDSSENVSLNGNTGIYELIINDKIDYDINKNLSMYLIFNYRHERVYKSIECIYSNRFFNTIINASI